MSSRWSDHTCVQSLDPNVRGRGDAADRGERTHKSCPTLANVGVSGYVLSFSTLLGYLQYSLTPLHFVMFSAAHIHSPPYSLSLSLLLWLHSALHIWSIRIRKMNRGGCRLPPAGLSRPFPVKPHLGSCATLFCREKIFARRLAGIGRMRTQKVLSRTTSCKIPFSRANINAEFVFLPSGETEQNIVAALC